MYCGWLEAYVGGLWNNSESNEYIGCVCIWIDNEGCKNTYNNVSLRFMHLYTYYDICRIGIFVLIICLYTRWYMLHCKDNIREAAQGLSQISLFISISISSTNKMLTNLLFLTTLTQFYSCWKCHL